MVKNGIKSRAQKPLYSL